jgi:hypothetical protein
MAGSIMATTTPQFGWSVPTSTDYVKDGATAIETLGDAIDARFGNAATYPNQIVNVVSGVSRPVAFAMAAGVATLTGVTAVTMPTSRFSQNPMVQITPTFGGSSSNSYYSIILSTSTTSVSMYNVRNDGVLVNGDVHWLATQMTSAASAG